MKVLTDPIEILMPERPGRQYWPELATGEFGRILIIKPSAVGDIVRTLPVLTAIRRRWPEAHIAWLVASHCSGVLTGHPALNEVIPFDRKRYGKLGQSLSAMWAFVQFMQRLRGGAFDLVIDMQGLFRSGFFSLVSGAPVRIGRGDAREMTGLFYSHRAAVDERRMHAFVLNCAMVAPLGITVQPSPADLYISQQAREGAQQTLLRAGVGPGVRYMVIAPGSNWETKNWPAEKFGQAARLLRTRCGLVPVVVGTADQWPMAEAIRAQEPDAADLCGKSSLAELAAVIEGAAVLLANDSGPLHIADALDMPMVGVFGPTDPRIVGPFNRVDGVVQGDCSCRCCGIRKLAQCPHGHRCMRALDAEAVADMTERQITRAKRGGR